MPILPSDIAKITSEETDSESPISEQTLQKIGSTINGLVDTLGVIVQFTSSTTFQIPENVTRVFVLGAGGGGGGAGGNSGGTLAGGGGAGCVPQLISMPVTPLTTYTVTIGTGGNNGNVNGVGGDGGNTSFLLSGIGPIFYGGKGGTLQSSPNFSGGNGLNYTGNIEPVTQANTAFQKWTNFTHFTFGGTGSAANSTTGQPGQDSPYAGGGAGGTGSDCGGGGGAGFGAGGNGSSTTSGTATTGGRSAGGGGGGGNKVGGNGGAGLLYVIY